MVPLLLNVPLVPLVTVISLLSKPVTSSLKVIVTGIGPLVELVGECSFYILKRSNNIPGYKINFTHKGKSLKKMSG